MSDLQSFLQYYLTLQILGLSVWPLTKRLFPNFPDRGWAFSKILGILLVSWVVWLLGSVKAAPFTRITIIVTATIIATLNWFAVPLLRRLKHQAQSTLPRRVKAGKFQISTKHKAPNNKRKSVWNLGFENWNLFGAWNFEFGALKIILCEELLFLASFAFWSWIRGFSPDIRGLEKFMDYGFVLSILRGKYFPPLDHFLSGSTINYYYFGHLITALLTRLSGVLPNIAFNLQIANLFGLTVLGSFSIGAALFAKLKVKSEKLKVEEVKLRTLVVSGFLTALFVAVIGNLHTVINIFREGQSYWYPTATRLIPYTIHEFPIYSFVVADLHGHVSDLPIVLLTIGLLISYVFFKHKAQNTKNQINPKSKAPSSKRKGVLNFEFGACNLFGACNFEFGILTVLALSIGAMFATNTWDFLIYWLLTGLVFLYLNYQPQKPWLQIFLKTAKTLIPVFIFSILFFLPYHLTVKPIAKGIGFVHDWSPPWLWFQMWGFHLLLALAFVSWVFRNKTRRMVKPEFIVTTIARVLGVNVQIQSTKFQTSTKFKAPSSKQAPNSKHQVPNNFEFGISDDLALIFIGLSAMLIILPEIIYFKDIYPTHYRANTMFKFFYQAWILLGIACSYGLLRVLRWLKRNKNTPFRFLFFSFSVLLFFSVLLYPYIALRSSANRFQNNKGLDGTKFLELYFPADAKAIDWLNENVSGQPTIVEAVGESYTDYSRICSNTGLLCVLGWPVHEWLWRGSYDEAGKRTADVQTLYETDSIAKARELLEKYKVDYVYIGGFEREKYKNLNAEKFKQLGEVVYENEEAVVYRISN